MTPLPKLKLLLLPVLLSQAWRAKQKAPALPEADGERSGRIAGGDSQVAPTLRVLIVGDSSAAGVGVAHQQQALVGHLTRTLAAQAGLSVHWQLLAKKGVTSEQALALVQSQPPQPADIAVVALGVNDVIGQVTPQRALEHRKQLAEWLQQRIGVRHTVFAPLPPVHRLPLLPQPLRWVAGSEARDHDAEVARWAATRADVHHVPIEPDVSPHNMAADGFHPAEPVYREVGEALARFIAEQLITTETTP